MKRTWGFDVMRCARCSRKMRVLAMITAPHVVRQILDHLGFRSAPRVAAPARDPPWSRWRSGSKFGFEAAWVGDGRAS